MRRLRNKESQNSWMGNYELELRESRSKKERERAGCSRGEDVLSYSSGRNKCGKADRPEAPHCFGVDHLTAPVPLSQ